MKPIETCLDFIARKKASEKVSMLTCYDHWSAQLLAKSEIDAILVGDSVAMVMHGYPNTLHADIAMMTLHTKAVAKGAPEKFLVADMPFMSFRKGINFAADSAEQLMKAGAHSVKIEGIDGHEDIIEHLVKSGIPVMGHLGLTPQFLHQLGGYKVQGRDEQSFAKILEQSATLESLGVFSLVLECVPSPLAERITQKLSIPTIGIGAGDKTDGQILVLQDMLGANLGFSPRFLRRFGKVGDSILDAVQDFDGDVKKGLFPTLQESYSS